MESQCRNQEIIRVWLDYVSEEPRRWGSRSILWWTGDLSISQHEAATRTLSNDSAGPADECEYDARSGLLQNAHDLRVQRALDAYAVDGHEKIATAHAAVSERGTAGYDASHHRWPLSCARAKTWRALLLSICRVLSCANATREREAEAHCRRRSFEL